MRPFWTLVGGVLAVACVIGSSAEARADWVSGGIGASGARSGDGDVDAWMGRRPLTLEGHTGFGTPVGGLGVMLDYLLIPAISLGAGAGAGSGPSGSFPLHSAIAVRVRPIRAGVSAMAAFVVGAAFSTGPYRRFALNLGIGEGTPRATTATWAHFLQAEIGFEGRMKNGPLFRATVGGAAMLNPGALQCTEQRSNAEPFTACDPFPSGSRREFLPTADLVLGYSF